VFVQRKLQFRVRVIRVSRVDVGVRNRVVVKVSARVRIGCRGV